MVKTYYVVADEHDPGSYHFSEAEALKVLKELQAKGYKNAVILYPNGSKGDVV